MRANWATPSIPVDEHLNWPKKKIQSCFHLDGTDRFVAGREQQSAGMSSPPNKKPKLEWINGNSSTKKHFFHRLN
jgi:hypothetical protein